MNLSPVSAHLPSVRTPPKKPRGRPPKETAGSHPNNLLALRLHAPGQPTQAEAAAAVGLTEKTYGKRERGEVKISDKEARALARYFAVDHEEITGSIQDRMVKIEGYVGAGAEIYPIDDGADFGEVECPRGLDPKSVAAVEVRGTSMSPIEEGWILFYTRIGADVVPIEALRKICVVKLAGGGPTLVKRVFEGSRPRRFLLISNNADPIQDVALAWAAPVRAIIDPELAGRRLN